MAREDAPEKVNFEHRWRERFTGFACDNEDDAGIAGWSSSGLQARVRQFSRFWRPGVNDRLWLDVGCGAGTYSRFIASHGLKVLGMDYCVPAVVKAGERDTSNNYWVVGDARYLPVKNGAFDGVLCFGVIQALTESDAALRELTCAVRSGGQVWVDALNSNCFPHLWGRFWRKIRGQPLHLRYESPDRLIRIMHNCGLGELELFWTPILPASMQSFQWIFESKVVSYLLHRLPLLASLLSHAFVLKARKLE